MYNKLYPPSGAQSYVFRLVEQSVEPKVCIVTDLGCNGCRPERFVIGKWDGLIRGIEEPEESRIKISLRRFYVDRDATVIPSRTARAALRPEAQRASLESDKALSNGPSRLVRSCPQRGTSVRQPQGPSPKRPDPESDR